MKVFVNVSYWRDSSSNMKMNFTEHEVIARRHSTPPSCCRYRACTLGPLAIAHAADADVDNAAAFTNGAGARSGRRLVRCRSPSACLCRLFRLWTFALLEWLDRIEPGVFTGVIGQMHGVRVFQVRMRDVAQ